MQETPEEQQAREAVAKHRTVRALAEAAQERVNARRALDTATDRVRDAVLAARAAGVSVRRTAEVGEVSPDTVNVWVQTHRERARVEVRRLLEQAAAPNRRAWHLIDRYVPTRPPAAHSSVLLYGEPAAARVILAAGYAHFAAAAPQLIPEAGPTERAISTELSELAILPAQTPLRDVLAAVDYRAVDRLAAPLDRAVRRLLQEPREVWHDVLAAHLPPQHSDRSVAVGAVGARQRLDAVLAGPSGGYAPGAVVRMLDGEQLAVVVEAQWTRKVEAPTGYRVKPIAVGQEETEVDAEQLADAAAAEAEQR